MSVKSTKQNAQGVYSKANTSQDSTPETTSRQINTNSMPAKLSHSSHWKIHTPEKQAKTLKIKSNKHHSSWCHAQDISTNIKPDEYNNKDF